MNHRICQVLYILSLLLTYLNLRLRILLHLIREISASRYTFTAEFEALVDLAHWSLDGVEAVHAAPGALVVHNVELLVEESVEAYLPVFEPLV